MLRQASYAMSIGRVIDSVDVALYGLRRRLQSTLGIESFVDPRLLPASQHGMVAPHHSDTNVCGLTILLLHTVAVHGKPAPQRAAHGTQHARPCHAPVHIRVPTAPLWYVLPTHPPGALIVPTCSPLFTSIDYKPQQQDATTVSRRAMLQTLVRCSAHQAVIGSLLSTDGAMGTASLQMQNAFGWRPLHMAVGNA